MLLRNLPVKAASVLLAIFLWFWVIVNERNPILEQPVTVPIVASDIGAGLALQEDLPKAEVRLRGLKRDVEDAAGKVDATVVCRGLGEGSHRLPVTVRKPEEVTVVSVDPDRVSIVLEGIISGGRPVELRRTGDLPDGYELAGVTYSPTTVQASGSRSRVDRVSRVLASLDLARVVPGVPLSLSARPVDSAGAIVDGVTISPNSITVKADLRPLVVSQTLPVRVRTQGSLAAGLELVSVGVEPPMVTVLLPTSRVGEVTHIDTEELPLSAARASFARNLRLALPEGVNLISEPEVRVSVRIAVPAAPSGEAGAGEDAPPDTPD
jgi:YbbR domain-containing protein